MSKKTLKVNIPLGTDTKKENYNFNIIEFISGISPHTTQTYIKYGKAFIQFVRDNCPWGFYEGMVAEIRKNEHLTKQKIKELNVKVV